MKRILAYLIIVMSALLAGFLAFWMPAEGLKEMGERNERD